MVVDAGIEKTWRSWTLPDHIRNWNNANEDWHTPSAENDLWVGGKFSYRMEAVDGSMGFDFEGTYTEIVDHKLICYEMEDGRKVEVHFARVDGGIQVTENFDPEDQNSRDLQQQGWQAILENFKRYTEDLITA